MPAPLGFLDSLDIANRVAQHLGQPLISSIDENSRICTEVTFAYDKLRQAELERRTWVFSTRRVILRPIDTTTFMLVPKPWDATVNYSQSSIVADSNGVYWSSLIPNNLNNDPVKTTAWEQYFGPLTVYPWAQMPAGYFSGELTYLPLSKPGSFAVFRSLTNLNSDTPNVAEAWDTTVLYNKGNTVTYGGSQWQSLIEVNQGNAPADAPLPFDITGNYASGQVTLGSDGYSYQSVNSNNIGHDPVTDGGANWTALNVPAAWSRNPILFPSARTWLPLYAGLENIEFSYPIGSGPSSQSSTRNIFKLPAGYLRSAAQDPKAGSNSILGASTGLLYNDWEFENGYLVSRESSFIMLRFVADVKDVSRMNAMFCEGLAARIAFEVCEAVTQSTTKQANLAKIYKQTMDEAGTVNAIEAGSEEPPVDDWEACRI